MRVRPGWYEPVSLRIATAHQPVYLPWLGLLHKIALADTYVFLDTVKYSKNDWYNRNRVKTASGPAWLTVPVTGVSGRVPLKDVRIANDRRWPRKHWLTLRTAYAHAPYFRDYAAALEAFYRPVRPWTFLVDLNEAMLRWLMDALRIETRFVKASDEQIAGSKSELIVEVCRCVNASAHLFGAQGVNYADADLFGRHNIRIAFQQYRHPVYPQQHGAFESHLSVIDLLFNCGPNSLDVLMSDNVSPAAVRAWNLPQTWLTPEVSGIGAAARN